MKRIIETYLIVVFSLSTIQSAQNKLNFDFDYAQFKYDSISNYFEIYYSLNKNDLTVINENGISLNKAIMYVKIQNIENDELVVNKKWNFEQKTNKLIKKGNKIFGVVSFIIKHGSYKIIVGMNDFGNSKLNKEYQEEINIRSFLDNHCTISDIELASRIINENANKNSMFYKNTFEVFPNPSMVYTNHTPVLFYYAEIYNLELLTDGEKIKLNRTLRTSQNKIVYESSKFIKKDNNAIVDIGAINLQKFPSGTYTLLLSLSDNSSKPRTVSLKKIFLVNPDVVIKNRIKTTSDFLTSEFSVLMESECDDIFEKSKIIAILNEIKNYNRLDSLDSKRKYLYDFWRRRDTTPETEINETKRNYFKAIKIANERYRTTNKMGYKTDRGRVFIQFGEPDEIERHPNETNVKPYEVWIYNSIEGGVRYIFGDVTGFNYYELLHSNKRGEMQDPNWQRRITQ